MIRSNCPSPRSSMPDRQPQRLRGLAVAALFSLGAAGFTGCDRFKKPEEAPPAPVQIVKMSTAVLDAEGAKQAKAMARERLADAMTREPKFDRSALTFKILLDTYKVDYKTLFPDEIDPSTFKDFATIKSDVTAAIEADADIKFPPAQKESLIQEAIVKFPLYDAGKTVQLSLKGDRKAEGVITEAGPTWVKIGLEKYAFDDILAPDPMLFQPERVATLRAQHVRIGYDLGRGEYTASELNRRMPRELRANGFVKAEGIAAPFIRIDELIEKHVAPEVDKAETAYNDALLEETKKRVEQQMINENIIPGIIKPVPGGNPNPTTVAAVAVAPDSTTAVAAASSDAVPPTATTPAAAAPGADGTEKSIFDEE